MMNGDPDPLIWRILCQIRNIKYCAEPSVRESPEHEGSLQRWANLRVMLYPPANAVNPQRHPAGKHPSDQDVTATCHALRWRQRYCRTRYTRRYSLCRDLCINARWLVIPAISRIARSLNRQDRGRQQTYECTYNNQSELHHDLSRVWGLIPREWNTVVDVYRYRRPYPNTGSNREHISMQHNTWDKSRLLRAEWCARRTDCIILF